MSSMIVSKCFARNSAPGQPWSFDMKDYYKAGVNKDESGKRNVAIIMTRFWIILVSIQEGEEGVCFQQSVRREPRKMFQCQLMLSQTVSSHKLPMMKIRNWHFSHVTLH